MIKQIFQNMVAPKTVLSSDDFGRNFNIASVSQGFFTRMFDQLRRRVHASFEKWQHEHEIEKAIVHMRGLTGEQLCDMGITYDDIPHVVRYGREAI